MVLERRRTVRWTSLLTLMLFGLLQAGKVLGQSEDVPAGPVFSDRVTSLLGMYQAVPAADEVLGARGTNPSLLNELPLTPAAAKARIVAQHGPDPKDLCQVLGPFRLMARPDVRLEILRDAPNKIVIVFENVSWGNVRNIRLDANALPVVPGFRPLWNGDSIATWQWETLMVDSVHFTSKTWLNETGVVNSSELHLHEAWSLVDHGNYLKYQATAIDPIVLTAPVSYTRYYKRTAEDFREYNCFDHRQVLASKRP